LLLCAFTRLYQAWGFAVTLAVYKMRCVRLN
jgi:hypothetical protein